MCLIYCAYEQHPDYPLILAGNRDEFYERPTAPAGYWQDHLDVLGGRDLEQGGTWLAINRRGRLATVTNYRSPDETKKDALSRGAIPAAFLTGETKPEQFIESLRPNRLRYNGYNLLIYDNQSLHYYGSVADLGRELQPGLYGLSNHLLDTPWPKVEEGKAAFAELLNAPRPEDLFALLGDTTIAADERLPDTGVGAEYARLLAPRYIRSPVYGTRASTVFHFHRDGRVRFEERRFEPGGEPAGGDVFTVQLTDLAGLPE